MDASARPVDSSRVSDVEGINDSCEVLRVVDVETTQTVQTKPGYVLPQLRVSGDHMMDHMMSASVNDRLLRIEKLVLDVTAQQTQAVDKICQELETHHSSLKHLWASQPRSAGYPLSTPLSRPDARFVVGHAKKADASRKTAAVTLRSQMSGDTRPSEMSGHTMQSGHNARQQSVAFEDDTDTKLEDVPGSCHEDSFGRSTVHTEATSTTTVRVGPTPPRQDIVATNSEKKKPGKSSGMFRQLRYSMVETSKNSYARTDSAKKKLAELDLVDDGGRPFWNRVVASTWFDSICAFVLLTNAMFIGIQINQKAQSGESKTPVGMMVGDTIYCFLFVLELLARFAAVGIWQYFTGEDRNWNTFDFIIVAVSSVENIIVISSNGDPAGAISSVSVLRIIRVVRIVRVVRVFRLMRFFRSLRILVNAILNTVKNCVWTSLLLIMILYIFGILFAQAAIDHLLETDEAELLASKETEHLRHYFSTVPRGVYTCFRSILGGIDWEIAADALSDLGAFYVFNFIVLIVFVYLAVLNVISGIFIQSSIEEAQQDLDHIIAQELTEKNKFLEKFEHLFDDMDVNENKVVNLDEFEHALEKPGMQNLLRAMGVEANDAWTLFKLLDTDGGGTVDREEFLEGCVALKGPARSIHIAQQRYESKWLIDAVLKLSVFCEDRFKDLLEERESGKSLKT